MNDSKLILVIDDDDIARQAMIETLQAEGFATDEAKNGKDGLEKALALHPALVLTDNIMPIQNGTEMLTELREDDWGAHVPVILLTSHYSLDAVNDTLEASGTDFLIKDDTSLQDIVKTINARLA